MPPIRTGVEVALRSVLAPGFLAARWVGQQRVAGPDDPPPPPRSVSLAAKAVLDEVFFLIELVSARFVATAGPRAARGGGRRGPRPVRGTRLARRAGALPRGAARARLARAAPGTDGWARPRAPRLRERLRAPSGRARARAVDRLRAEPHRARVVASPSGSPAALARLHPRISDGLPARRLRRLPGDVAPSRARLERGAPGPAAPRTAHGRPAQRRRRRVHVSFMLEPNVRRFLRESLATSGLVAR
jgi:hypothetical protein